MADLQLAPPQPRSVWPAILIAALVVTAGGYLVFRLNPTRTGTLTAPASTIYEAHTTFSPQKSGTHGMNIIGGSSTTETDLYVVATVEVHNDLRLPMFTDTVAGTFTNGRGEVLETTAADANDTTHAEEAFPALKPMLPNAIVRGTEIAPGATLRGEVLFSLPGMSAKDWSTRQGMTVQMHFAHQPPLAAKLP